MAAMRSQYPASHTHSFGIDFVQITHRLNLASLQTAALNIRVVNFIAHNQKEEPKRLKREAAASPARGFSQRVWEPIEHTESFAVTST